MVKAVVFSQLLFYSKNYEVILLNKDLYVQVSDTTEAEESFNSTQQKNKKLRLTLYRLHTLLKCGRSASTFFLECNGKWGGLEIYTSRRCSKTLLNKF